MKSTIVAVAVALSLSAYAQDQEPNEGATRMRPDNRDLGSSIDPVLGVRDAELNDLKQKVSVSDRMFIKDAAQASLAQIQMGRLAKNNAKSEAVKQLGQKLIDDNQKANRQLDLIATRLGVTLPTQLDERQQLQLRRLGTLRGGEFDTVFTRQTIDGQEQVLSMFRKEARRGQSRDLRNFAERTIPMLEEDLQLSTELRTGKAYSSL